MTNIEYKMINARPPIYDAIVSAGLVFNENSTVFAYNGAIYNPSDLDLPNDIIAHEMVHMVQQGDGEESAKKWWDRYLTDPYFRIQQEIEAYATQYRYLCTTIKDRERRFRILRRLAEFLSGPMYGNMISVGKAIEQIKNYKPKNI